MLNIIKNIKQMENIKVKNSYNLNYINNYKENHDIS